MLRGNVGLLITFSFLVSTSSTTVDRNQKVEQVKQYILNQLDFNQPPPNASDSATPKEKLAEYRMQMHRPDASHKQCGEQDPRAKSIFTIGGQPLTLQGSSESGSGIDKRASGDHNIDDTTLTTYNVDFTIDTTISPQNIYSVELLVYKERSKLHSSVDLFQLVELTERWNLKKIVAVRIVNVFDQQGYISFDVTKAATGWIQQGLHEIHLVLTVKCINSWQCDLGTEHQVHFNTSAKPMRQPHLIIETYIRPQHTRRKRSNHHKGRFPFCNANTTKFCCLKELEFNFTEVGWGFVITPKTIHVNYCDGLCPLGTDLTNSHSESLAEIHSSSSPCCTPASYDPVSLLIQNEHGNLTVIELPKMTATSCRCG